LLMHGCHFCLFGMSNLACDARQVKLKIASTPVNTGQTSMARSLLMLRVNH
jgi:hypothetical protein